MNLKCQNKQINKIQNKTLFEDTIKVWKNAKEHFGPPSTRSKINVKVRVEISELVVDTGSKYLLFSFLGLILGPNVLLYVSLYFSFLVVFTLTH